MACSLITETFLLIFKTMINIRHIKKGEIKSRFIKLKMHVMMMIHKTYNPDLNKVGIRVCLPTITIVLAAILHNSVLRILALTSNTDTTDIYSYATCWASRRAAD